MLPSGREHEFTSKFITIDLHLANSIGINDRQ